MTLTHCMSAPFRRQRRPDVQRRMVTSGALTPTRTPRARAQDLHAVALSDCAKGCVISPVGGNRGRDFVEVADHRLGHVEIEFLARPFPTRNPCTAPAGMKMNDPAGQRVSCPLMKLRYSPSRM